MEEFWRRGFCQLSSIHQPAEKQAVVPREVGGVPVLEPRLIGRTGQVSCYASDGDMLWAADDQSLYQIDAAGGKLLCRYDRTAGLPDSAIESISVCGGDVLLCTRAGLACLDGKTGKIAVVEGPTVTMGRLAVCGRQAWLIGDGGAYLRDASGTWRRLAEFPGQKELAALTAKGCWFGLRSARLASAIPWVHADKHGLCAVVFDKLVHCDAAGGGWHQAGGQVWQAAAGQDGAVWALATAGLVRYDPGAGRADTYAAGKGLAAGRPVALVAMPGGCMVASEPDYDPKARQFVGGGISRFNAASGAWTVTDSVDGRDVRFVTALCVDGARAAASCVLYDRAVEMGAHPGMAHVKRWRPHTVGLGFLHWDGGKWGLVAREGLKTERRWVLGQKGKSDLERIGPESVDSLCCLDGRAWAVYRMVGEVSYAGYFVSAGCIAANSPAGQWRGVFETRTDQLGLAGEQPELLLISLSHGDTVVLGESQPTVLDIVWAGGRTWAVCQSGLYSHDVAADRFTPIVEEPVRLYWRATAAAADKDGVWFGGDSGTVSRLDRATGRLELVGVAPGRKITAMSASDGALSVRTARADVVLPAGLASARRLPEGDRLVYDGREWSASAAGGTSGSPASAPLDYRCQDKSNYLYRGQAKVGFLKGPFQPQVLCQDAIGGKLWLACYSGVAWVPLPTDGAKRTTP
jgi:outer membrane protein assembly factor BamB